MFPHAYPLEFFHTLCALVGVLVNLFTWLTAKVDLRWAEEATPYSGARVAAGRSMVRREYVSLVYVQGLMLALGLMSLTNAPPPWPWDVGRLEPLPWRELAQDQRTALFYAWVWRLGIATMCLRKAWNSVQNWFEERPLRVKSHDADALTMPAPRGVTRDVEPMP